jgi:aminoglycoside phosphotransferase (APT) family kinase protein
LIASLTEHPPADQVLDYLRERLVRPTLGYAEEPRPITDGWETFIERFRLESAEGLAPDYTAPLILRCYSCDRGLARLQHEFAVQRHMHGLGYPVPRPLFIEENPDFLGGPFMIQEQVAGSTMLQWMFRRPWHICDAPVRMAMWHDRLHRLPSEGFPDARPHFLDRHLGMLAEQIRTYDLDGLRPGLNWLNRHRPHESDRPSILHMDLHPINIMIDRGRVTAVLDWCEADVGDRCADVAISLLLLKTAPIELPGLWEQMSSIPGRWALHRWYRMAYLKRHPCDRERLRYYLAWAALRRLCRYGMWLIHGPAITGHKPSSIRYLDAARIRALEDSFSHSAGIEVHLHRLAQIQVSPPA